MRAYLHEGRALPAPTPRLQSVRDRARGRSAHPGRTCPRGSRQRQCAVAARAGWQRHPRRKRLARGAATRCSNRCSPTTTKRWPTRVTPTSRGTGCFPIRMQPRWRPTRPVSTSIACWTTCASAAVGLSRSKARTCCSRCQPTGPTPTSSRQLLAARRLLPRGVGPRLQASLSGGLRACRENRDSARRRRCRDTGRQHVSAQPNGALWRSLHSPRRAACAAGRRGGRARAVPRDRSTAAKRRRSHSRTSPSR